MCWYSHYFKKSDYYKDRKNLKKYMNKIRKKCYQSKPINLLRKSHIWRNKDFCVPKKKLIDLLYTSNTITSEVLLKSNFNSIVLFVFSGFPWLVVTVLWWFHLKTFLCLQLRGPFPYAFLLTYRQRKGMIERWTSCI